ncbi:UPF0407 protein C2orf39 [Histomonas meleagridis]|uniref:UPF0407 protein C2orf39 n=1 Tax=Histomonas meleagridis TaxID=135588 RepID=UPI003559D1DC|nr:UPF0407 protein C2orf39 [Histomonas meleagridis]KAH0801803.1 UPF0407 protein C2orf39 [Histomonas meleagridis]
MESSEVSVLTVPYEKRSPIMQSQESLDTIKNSIEEVRNNLSGIIQQQLSIEQERTNLFKEIRTRFDEEFSTIEEKVTEGMNDLEDGWKNLLNQNLPLEFEKALRQQKQSTDDVVALKLAYIKDLQQEVMKRDHEYVNKISAQNKQVDTFVHQMRTQEEAIRTKISDELHKVRSSFEQEKTLQMAQIEREIKQITAKRQEKEKSLSNEIEEIAKSQRDTLEEIRQTSAEKYMSLRTEFATKLQNMQKQYENSIAEYQFSLEQLEYYLKILQENEEEHEEKVKLQMKKLIRQRDTLRDLKKRYEIEDKEFERQNSEITKDYKRIAQSYREYQTRFRNVAYNDFNAFRKVWNLNEKRLHELVLKALEADRVVMEQELGKPSRKTDPIYLQREILSSKEFEGLIKSPTTTSTTTNSENDTNQKQNVTTTTSPTTTLLKNQTLSEPLEHLWRLVSDEVGFLVDERVKDLIGIDEKSQDLIRVDLLLQDLGITQQEDIEQLLSYFLKDTEFGELETPGFVSPHEVLEGLRKFVDEYHPKSQQNQTNLYTQITVNATQNTSSEVAKAIMQLQQKMKKDFINQRKFYEKKGGVITEEMWRAWNTCFKALQRYVAELEERAKLIEEVEKLKTQNAEFEMILSQYIQSENNDALIYAPAETVDFQTM